MKLDDETAAWIDSAMAWWLHQLGPIGGELVLPIDDHFPRGEPQALLEAVLGFAGMGDWRLELVDESDAMMADPLAGMPRPAAPYAIHAPDEPEDRPLPQGGPYPIPYTREDTRDPLRLITSFARSASHYLLYEAEEDPPGEEDDREALVEVGAVMMGFGVFLANSAFRFEQFDNGGLHGWSSSAQGALGEDALGYALAMFVELTGRDAKPALGQLAANPKAAFKWARGQLQGRRRSTVERLRAIVPRPRDEGPYR